MADLRFMSLSSGSNGNCYYLGTEHYGILIDVGLSQRRITKLLSNVNIDFSRIYGVLVTHAHADHVRGANSISNRLRVPFYSTKETFSLTSTGYRSQYEIENNTRNVIEPYVPFEIGEFKITAFPLPHDIHNVGYKIEFRDKTLTLATDIGQTTDYLNTLIGCSDYLIIEANYDYDMLLHGSYPYALKQRIMGGNGHLSNDQTADILKKYGTEQLKRVYLCHLSAHNNRPDIAEETVKKILSPNVKLEVLPRTHPTLLVEL